MSAELLFGIDGGATKTECIVSGIDGHEMVVVRGGPTNHEHVGYEKAAGEVKKIVFQALKEINATVTDIAAACFAMGGMDIPPDRSHIMETIVTPLGLSCPIKIINDAFAGFRAGSARGVGVMVSLGSGITFCGGNELGEMAQFEKPQPQSLLSRIFNALLAEYQRIGPQCTFRNAFLKAAGYKSLQALAWSLYAISRSYISKPDHSRFPLAREVVFRKKFEHDPVLHDIFAHLGDEFAEILIGLARRLDLCQKDFDLVLSGSILTKGRNHILNGHIIEGVKTHCPLARPVIVDGPPAKGAILIARELFIQQRD